MIKTPFKEGHKRTYDEADVREFSRTSQTSWKGGTVWKKLQREQRKGEGGSSSQD
jgi:hypothetical protein